MFLIFFLLFEFYVTLVDGRFPVKMLIFTIGVIIKTFPQRKHCTLTLECQEFVKSLFTCQLQHRSIGFEKAKIYRGFLPIKEVIKTDNSNRTSTPSTFVAEKTNVLGCYRHPMWTGSLHYSFLSFFFFFFFISSNEWDLTIYISSNEWDLIGGTTVNLISMRTRCFHYCRKSRSPSHNFFVLKHVTLQILDFISVI